MNQLVPIISVTIVTGLMAFWLWMFWDMTNNDHLPSRANASFSWPPYSKFDWTLVFIFMNVFGAVYYYSVEYKNRH